MLIIGFCILVAGNLVAGGFLFNYFVGIPYWLGAVIIAILAVAYTGTGGLIADAYTAIIQMALILVGAVGLLIWMAVTHGLAIEEGMGPLDLGQMTDPAQGATINWATLIALGIGDIVAIDFMQRVFAAKSPETARRACFGAATGVVAICVPFGLVVLSAKAFLPEELDGPILFVLLDQYAPVFLTIIVLCGLVGASMSTANGAILAISNVSVRNLGGVRRVHVPGQRDPLLWATRIAMVPMTVLAILIAIYVKQTGILLTLAFDLLLACLVVPFILGLVWRRGTAAAALVSIVVGLAVRLVLFVMTPTMYGLDNTILYIPNGVFDASFDGWPTFIAFGASLVTYVAIALVTPPAPIRGLDIQVARGCRRRTRRGGRGRAGAGTGQGRGGATVAHGTVRTPSRMRRRGGSTGQPLSRNMFSIAASIFLSAQGCAASAACWARRNLDAATICIALVIFCVALVEAMRTRMSLSDAILRSP